MNRFDMLPKDLKYLIYDYIKPTEQYQLVIDEYKREIIDVGYDEFDIGYWLWKRNPNISGGYIFRSGDKNIQCVCCKGYNKKCTLLIVTKS